MSWSAQVVGKPKAAAAKFAIQIGNIKCAEPEETIKGKVGDIVAAALASFPDRGYAVKVSASGSQSNVGDGAITNTVRLEIDPVWGFCE